MEWNLQQRVLFRICTGFPFVLVVCVTLHVSEQPFSVAKITILADFAK